MIGFESVVYVGHVGGSIDELTIGRTYAVEKFGHRSYLILNGPMPKIYPREYFITLEEKRDRLINQLINE